MYFSSFWMFLALFRSWWTHFWFLTRHARHVVLPRHFNAAHKAAITPRPPQNSDQPGSQCRNTPMWTPRNFETVLFWRESSVPTWIWRCHRANAHCVTFIVCLSRIQWPLAWRWYGHVWPLVLGLLIRCWFGVAACSGRQHEKLHACYILLRQCFGLTSGPVKRRKALTPESPWVSRQGNPVLLPLL